MIFSQESKFKDILQPIKDLASSWDIDVSSSLDEYLSEIEEIYSTMKENLNLEQSIMRNQVDF